MSTPSILPALIAGLGTLTIDPRSLDSPAATVAAVALLLWVILHHIRGALATRPRYVREMAEAHAYRDELRRRTIDR
jgi:hypothetical protein